MAKYEDILKEIQGAKIIPLEQRIKLPTQAKLSDASKLDRLKQTVKEEKQKQIQTEASLRNYLQEQGVQTSNTRFSTPNTSQIANNMLQQSRMTLDPKQLNNPVYTDAYGNTTPNVFQASQSNALKYNQLMQTDEAKQKVEDIKKQVTKAGYAQYEYDKEAVNQDEIGWFDKSLGNITRGLGSLVDIGGEIYDEQGNSLYLPSKNELKSEKVNESYDTFIGKLLGNATYEGTRILASTALNAAIPYAGSAWYFTDMFDSSYNSARRDGYDEDKAVLYATLSTASEVIVGKLLGAATKGLTGGKSGAVDKAVKKVVTKLVGDNRFSDFVANATSEGLEEFVQEYIDGLNKNLTLGSDEKIFSQERLEDAIYSGFVGALTGGALGGHVDINEDLKTNINKNNEEITKLNNQKENTKNKTELKKINEDIKKLEEENIKYTKQIEENIKKYKLKDTIITVEDLVNQEKNQKEQQPKLDIRLQQRLEGQPNLPTQSYTTDTKNYTGSQLKTYQNAINSGLLNNNKNTHDFVDFVGKISKDKGITFNFTNNQALQDRNINAQINGFIDKNGITLNIDSNMALESVIGHEITHTLENMANEYNELKNSFKTLLGEEYNARLEQIKELYSGIEDANYENELISDLAGEYLFTNEEFINNLSTEKPSLFKRIYNEIKYLWKMATGTEQEKQLAKTMRIYENAYRNAGKATTPSTQYSLSQNYRGSHQIENAKSITELELDDVKNKIIEVDGYLTNQAQNDFNKLKKILNNHNETVKIYRAAPVNELNSGDWVTTDKSYAQNVADNNGGKVYTFEVKAKDLYYPDNIKDLPSLHRLSSFQYVENANAQTTTTDNQGRELSKKQQKYFKDSKVRDEEGRLLEVYHGTPNVGFTVFDTNKSSSNTQSGEYGIFFTDSKDFADDFSYERIPTDSMFFDQKGKKGNIYTAYLNAKNVLDFANLNEQEINELYNYASEIGKIDGKEKFVENMKKWQQIGNHQLMKGNLNLKEIADNSNYDGIKAKLNVQGNENEYIVFNSNQVKNVDNTNPTESEDIRYQLSKQDENLPKGQFRGKSVARDINIPTTQESALNVPINKPRKVLNPTEISNLKQENANTTPILPTTNTLSGDKQSKFLNNLNKTEMLSKESKNLINNANIGDYKSVTNEESLKNASEKLKKGGKAETERWFRNDPKNVNATDIAEGFILLNQYQEIAKNSNNEADKYQANQSMVEVAKKLRQIGTEAGQTLQAYSILSRMTPEGMVYYAQSELTDAYNEMVKNKSKEWIDKNRDKFELTPDETQFILDTMQEVSKMEDGYDKKVKLAEIQKLMTDKLPPEKGQKLKSWMRLSMLFNPKTQVRNIAGNALIAPVNSFGDIFASYADKLISKKTNIRTTGKTNVKAMLEGFKKGAYEATTDYKKGINTRDIEGNRFEIGDGKSFDNNKLIGRALNNTESLLNYVMDAGDRIFSEAAFENSLQNQLKLNNTTEITQDMIDIARQEALSRTWNDNNNYTKFVLNVRSMLNKINVGTYGLGDVLIPFAKTPANLTKAIVDYSPVGFVNTILKGRKLSRSLENGQYTPQLQHEFVQTLGKATAGTMLYVLGTALAKAGVISGESDDDKDTQNFLKNTLGVSNYSIKIGGKSFTYDWAQPLAAPLSITANIVNRKDKEQALGEAILSNLDTASSVLLEQSFMQGINEVLNGNGGIVDGLINQVLSLPARAIPTLSKQIVDLTDSTQRTSFEYGKPVQSAINAAKAKIPGLSQTLAPVVDTLGREVERYGGKNNIFNVFLNPASVNTENISEAASEIYKIYQATGDKTIMPRVAPYYINSKGEKITLNSKQKAEFQTISGSIIEENMNDLINNQAYQILNDSEKASMINDLVNYAYNKARKDILGIDMSNEYNKINEYVNDGGTPAEYYTNKEEINYAYTNPEKYSAIKQIASYNEYQTYNDTIKDIKEKYSTSNERKSAIINYVNGLPLNIPQKAMLIKMYYSSFKQYDNQIIEYVNSQDLTISQKSDILKEVGFTIKNGVVYK